MTKWIFILVLLFSCCKGYSQHGPNDTIRVGTIIIGKDTFIHKWLNEVYITEKAPKWYVKKLRKERKIEDR